jgi:hypothetical protein
MVEAHEIAPRIFISAGQLEDVPSTTAPQGMSLAAVNANKTIFSQVANAEALADQLRQVSGGLGYEVRAQAYKDEDHADMGWATMPQALRFALGN